jgi:hypothetical protein
MIRQPTPTVTVNDVERIVHRDFPQEQFAVVMDILSEYGAEKWQRECFRVRLAVLKLANGNLKDLRRCIETAKRDYRDVLAEAEYPGYMKRISQTQELASEERQKIIEADWNQYETWLKRNADWGSAW